MENVTRVEYYVGLDRSEWTLTDTEIISNSYGNVTYKIGDNYCSSTETTLEGFKITPSECLQDKNINRKNFNLCFYIDCYTKDVDTAKAKLKGRVILLLTKHQNKIDQLMSNL